ncbi:MAG: RelA/SpoT family protein [bacterium]
MIWSLRKKEIGSSTGTTKDNKDELENLLKVCRFNLKSIDENLISKAFLFCLEAYKNKSNESGVPYYKHSYYVAMIAVNEMPLDETSVICALLHDIPNDSDIFKLKDIKSEFGQTVAEIVEGINKIQHIENQNIESSENYRKLLLSLFKDVRIILIKIAETLQNMRDITDSVHNNLLIPDIDGQFKISTEALEIYCPFAHRFGLGNIKGELEDLAFQVTNPEKYTEIKAKVHGTRKERELYIKNFVKPLKDALEHDEIFKKNKIKFEINGRAKHIFSIYNKIHIRQLPLEKLNDLFAIRVIINSEDIKYCYIAYAIITSIYELVPETFKNYIANPKKNGYQSIHAALKGPDGSPVELQIRTRQMHLISEKGVASHFNYKRGFLPAQSVLDDENTEEWLNLIKSIFEKVGKGTSDELLESIKKNWHQDEIYVFTPAKEFKIFPKDATPLDFAFAIHSEIGEHCIGAKVNSKIVPLNYKLQSSDQIEIITSQNQTPNKDWLKIVVTQRAKNYLQKYFRDQKLKSEEKGQLIWDEFLTKMGFHVSEKKFGKILKTLNYDSKQDFFIALNTSGFNEQMLFDYIKELLREMKKKKEKKNKEKPGASSNGFLSGKGEENGNTKFNIDYRIQNINYADCCFPLPGDKIVGEISGDGKNMRVHRKKCNIVKKINLLNTNSVITLDWNNLHPENFVSKLRITGKEQTSIFAEITSCISSVENISIVGFNFKSHEEGFEGFLTLSFKDPDHILEIMEKIKKVEAVREVERNLE